MSEYLPRDDVLKVAEDYRWAGGLMTALTTLKPVEAKEVVIGAWHFARGGGVPYMRCTACGADIMTPWPSLYFNKWNYCPACGACVKEVDLDDPVSNED